MEAVEKQLERKGSGCSTSAEGGECGLRCPPQPLYVKRSWLSADGDGENLGFVFDGLFAGAPIKQGDTVTVYTGELYRTAAALKVEDKSYLMRLGEQCYIDARTWGPDGRPPCIARYINDCINPAGFNVKFVKQPIAQPHPCAVVVALRDIAAGEELFVDYGKWYWAGCRATLKPVRMSFMRLHLLRTAAESAEATADGTC